MLEVARLGLVQPLTGLVRVVVMRQQLHKARLGVDVQALVVPERVIGIEGS